MGRIWICRLSVFLSLLSGSTLFAQGNIDLNEWNQEGVAAAGNWVVAADGESVLQTVNGAPTFFVSPNNFINTTIGGSFGVETTSDDDFVGFVFAFNAPISGNGDPDLFCDFILFDWKQITQSGAPAGFWLGKVSGTQNGIAGIGNQLWTHTGDVNLEVTQLGTPLVNAGWQDNVVYEFDLVYTESQIQIYMQGGTGPFMDRQLIFDVNVADVPSGTFAGDVFPSGRFGFYNFSQSTVRYVGFTALTEVNVESVTTTRGDYVSGGLPELAGNDGADYVLRRNSSDIIARTEFEVTGTSPVENPSSLTVVLDGSVFGRSAITQSISLFDYVAGTWELIDSRAATQQQDQFVQVDLTSDFLRFIEPGTLNMKARLRFQSANARQQFSSNTDKFAWFVGD
jgi:hypothetical protein